MIEFESLVLQNFQSYGAIPTTIILNRPGTTLLLGEDLDNTASGAGANGVGKTALLNALTYGVYDQPISNISKDNLINNVNKKNMIVTVTFKKSGDRYTIVRSRKVKVGAAGNFTMLYKNGVDITPAGAENTNAEIVRIIGIPYEIFVRVVAFSAIHTPFLDLPARSGSAANQTDIIEELFNLKLLSEKAELLKAKIKDTEGSMKMQQELATHIEKEAERHALQLKSAEKRVLTWIDQNSMENLRIRRQIEGLQQIDVAQQKQVLSRIEELETVIETAMKEQEHWDSIKIDATKIVTEKKHEIKHLDGGKCPYCKQGFEATQSKRDAIDTTLESAQTQLKQANEMLTAGNTVMKKLTATYKQAKAQLTVKNLEELLSIDNNIKNLESKLASTIDAANPYMEPWNELKNIKLDEKDPAKVNELKRTLDHQVFLLKVLTKKDSFVRKELLNKNIPSLNKRLQTYLTDLGLPHTVEFTHELTAKISQFGHEMDFGNLSNGQRARVNLALSFAFRDVLQSKHDHVNICLLDEVLDVGLDTVGVQAAARMLKRKARDEKLALYIISHRDEIDSAFDRKMVVQLSGGFSSLRYEEE